jgi:hypothetical protein
MNFFRKYYQKIIKPSVWARPNMQITFRAELMPGKSREERTFKIEKVMANGRVVLEGFAGEHRQSEFEPVNYSK